MVVWIVVCLGIGVVLFFLLLVVLTNLKVLPLGRNTASKNITTTPVTTPKNTQPVASESNKIYVNTKSYPTPLPTLQPGTLKISVLCPVPKEFCASGKQIYDGSNFLGIGYKLPPGTKITSAIAGPAFYTTSADHSKTYVGGRDSNQNYSAGYEYFAPKISASQDLKEMSQGDALDTIGSGTFPNTPVYGGINLLFSITYSGNPVQFNTSDLR